MTFPFEENDEIVSDLEDNSEPVIMFNKEECAALLQECIHSYISYENPVARSVIRRMRIFSEQ